MTKQHWSENPKDLGKNRWVNFALLWFGVISIGIGFKNNGIYGFNFISVFLVLMGTLFIMFQDNMVWDYISHLKCQTNQNIQRRKLNKMHKGHIK